MSEKFQLSCLSSKREFPNWDTDAGFPRKTTLLMKLLLETSYALFVAKCAELTDRQTGEVESVKYDADKDQIICAPLRVGEQGFDVNLFSDVIVKAKAAFKYNKEKTNAICSKLLNAARGYSDKVDEFVRNVLAGQAPDDGNGQSLAPDNYRLLHSSR